MWLGWRLRLICMQNVKYNVTIKDNHCSGYKITHMPNSKINFEMFFDESNKISNEIRKLKLDIIIIKNITKQLQIDLPKIISIKKIDVLKEVQNTETKPKIKYILNYIEKQKYNNLLILILIVLITSIIVYFSFKLYLFRPEVKYSNKIELRSIISQNEKKINIYKMLTFYSFILAVLSIAISFIEISLFKNITPSQYSLYYSSFTAISAIIIMLYKFQSKYEKDRVKFNKQLMKIDKKVDLTTF
jgi:hypothetical protein